MMGKEGSIASIRSVCVGGPGPAQLKGVHRSKSDVGPQHSSPTPTAGRGKAQGRWWGANGDHCRARIGGETCYSGVRTVVLFFLKTNSVRDCSYDTTDSSRDES